MESFNWKHFYKWMGQSQARISKKVCSKVINKRKRLKNRKKR